MKLAKRPIASQDNWTLFEVVPSPDKGWKNFVLRKYGTGLPKRAWWLGWNGERLARNHDVALLAEHHKDVLDWVYEVMDGRAA